MYLLSNSELSQVSGGLTVSKDEMWGSMVDYFYISALTAGAVVATYSSFYRPITTTESFLNGLCVGVSAAVLGIEACKVYMAYSVESN